MRSAFVALILVAVGLAGCADGTAAAEEDITFDDFDGLEATDSTGIIRGVVVDETIAPIAGAIVTMQATGESTISDDQGRFAFADLEQGNYFLKIEAETYSSTQQSVEVIAGVEEPPIVRVMLQKIPGSDPMIVPLAWSGMLGCSARYFIEGRSCPGATAIWPDHDFLVDYELTGVPDHVQSNMQWKSTQALGGEMSFNLRRTDTNRDTIDIEGKSPLTLDMGPELIASDGGNRGGFDENNPLRVIIFTAHLKETEPPAGGLWGLGVQIDQKFDTYTHIFYNTSPPEGWNFLNDGSP